VLLPVITNSQPLSKRSSSLRYKVQKRNHVFFQIMQKKQRDFFTPSHTRTALVYSKYGFYLAVDQHGAVQGTTNTFCQQNRLQCE
jgi:hypothetical protein